MKISGHGFLDVKIVQVTIVPRLLGCALSAGVGHDINRGWPSMENEERIRKVALTITRCLRPGYRDLNKR